MQKVDFQLAMIRLVYQRINQNLFKKHQDFSGDTPNNQRYLQ